MIDPKKKSGNEKAIDLLYNEVSQLCELRFYGCGFDTMCRGMPVLIRDEAFVPKHANGRGVHDCKAILIGYSCLMNVHFLYMYG